jgi:DMSO reductase family type II enzyme heme b subunit
MNSLAKFFISLLGVSVMSASGSVVPSNPMPEVNDDFMAQGHEIYIQRCSFCHGLLGDGNGPTADFLDPRPRDFTLGIFKFRTTQSGELPTDEDLFRTVSRGLTGTAMQAFDEDIIKNGLTEEQRWAVIAYIKTFAFEFEDPELDPVKNGMVIPLPKDMAPYNADSIEKGKAVFERAKCWECHGKSGRGDGQKSFDRTDDWGFPIRIRNVTHPWKIKAGSEVEDIYMRFSTGILGTPMPSFVDALTEEDRWYLANFIKSLQHERTEHQVLVALKTKDSLPDDPFDPRWNEAGPMDIRLAGQVIGAPRWQNNSVDMVTIKAMFNEDEIEFLMVWDDPFQDIVHDESKELDTSELAQVGGFSSYIMSNDQVPRRLETFRDSIALQFPAKTVEGTKKPHFFRGSVSDPVNLWIWQPDKSESDGRSVSEAVARSWKQDYKFQDEESQQVEGSAVWDQGRWHVLMKRPRKTGDRNDVQFESGQFIPMSINLWDGSNGEHGLLMSLSSWYFVVLESNIPVNVYIYALVAGLLSVLLGGYLFKLANKT